MYIFSGISIDRLLSLDIYEYRLILINTIVSEARQTKEGRELLQRYAALQEKHTEFDVDGLKSIL